MVRTMNPSKVHPVPKWPSPIVTSTHSVQNLNVSNNNPQLQNVMALFTQKQHGNKATNIKHLAPLIGDGKDATDNVPSPHHNHGNNIDCP
mmetsp:Transcript_12884/g.18403  ORF Transcript_12884/g.18403 Transcript_12884/m.18403 type:complete len:90 (-) Transcript_12884:2977-3246(-)